MNMEELIDTMDTAAQREAFDLLFGGDSLGARPCAATGRSARSTLGGWGGTDGPSYSPLCLILNLNLSLLRQQTPRVSRRGGRWRRWGFVGRGFRFFG